MGTLLTKLNIIKGNTLVKRGQILYNSCKDTSILANDDKNLSEGFYFVRSSQVNYSSEKGKYFHNLELSPIDMGENGTKVSSEIISLSMDQEALNNNFGVNKTAKKGLMYEYIKDQFIKAGRGKDFDESYNYDSSLRNVGWSILRKKAPFTVSKDDGEDLILDALMKSIDKKAVDRYDSKRSLSKYIVDIFYKQMLDELKSYVNRHIKEYSPSIEDDSTQEEVIEVRREDHGVTPEKKVNYKELVNGIKKFMKSRPHGDKQINVFNMFIEGYSNNEIAEKLNLSASAISKLTQEIRESLLKYAEKTDNSDLLTLLVEGGMKRRHTEEETSFIVDVLKDYKKKFGGETRKPVGDITKIKKTTLKDKLSDEAITSAILNDSYSAKKLKEELADYYSLLEKQDELIEEDGKVVGIRIISDEVRNIEEKAKCKKKGAEGGFFVYSKCGLGPHKVLKEDGTFSIKLNRLNPVKVFKSKRQAEIAASRKQHTKLNLKVGVYPDEYLAGE